MSCSCAGISHPRIIYSLSPRGDSPPGNAQKRLGAGSAYPETFSFFFSQAGNSFTAYFIPTIFVNKPYEVLHIKEMNYEWEGNTGIL